MFLLINYFRMKTKLIFLLFIFLSLIAKIHSQSAAHLEPLDKTFDVSQENFAIDSKIAKALHVDSYAPVLRFMFVSSFSESGFLDLYSDGGNHHLIYLEKDEMYKSDIDSISANQLISLFEAAVNETKYNAEPATSITVDGIYYFFFLRSNAATKGGQTWSPPKDTPMGKLIVTFDELIELVKTKKSIVLDEVFVRKTDELKRELAHKKTTKWSGIPIKMVEVKDGKIHIVSQEEARASLFSRIKDCIVNGYICHINYISEYIVEEYFRDFEPVVIPEYFIWGIVGSQKVELTEEEDTSNRSLIDTTNPLTMFLEKYIEEVWDIQTSVRSQKKGVIGVYSPEVVRRINDFFYDETGSLKPGLFRTNAEAASYLTGVYYRSGVKKGDKEWPTAIYPSGIADSDSVYAIGIFSERIDEMFSLLRKVCCNNIFYWSSSARGFVPGAIWLFFEPSVYLEKYFEWIELEREIKRMQSDFKNR